MVHAQFRSRSFRALSKFPERFLCAGRVSIVLHILFAFSTPIQSRVNERYLERIFIHRNIISFRDTFSSTSRGGADVK